MSVNISTYVKEKWKHEGFQKYFQNMGWSFSGQMVSLVVSFFVGALVARYLGPQRYGVLNYAVSFVTVFVFMASFGVDNILVRELLKYKEKKEEILNTAFSLKLFGGFLVIIIATLFSIIFKNDFYTTGLIFIYSLHLIFLSFNVISSYFYATVKHKFLFLAQVISTVLVSVLKLFFVYQGFGSGWFVLALVFETAISSFVLLRFFKKSGNSLKSSLDLDLAKKLLSDSWPFIFSTAFYLIYTKIDQVMIGKMLDMHSIGIYSAGVKLAEMWFFIPVTICSVLFPAIVNSKIIHNDLYKTRLKKIFIFIISLAFFIALFEFVFAKFLVLVVFGKEFLGSVIILKIYTWAGVIFSAIAITQQYLIIENKTKLMMIASFFGALVNILLNFIFIKNFGIIGSAWATIISYIIIPIIIFTYLKIESNKNVFLRKNNKN